MKQLSQREIECLEKLDRLGGRSTQPPGDALTLDSLIELGLVERVNSTSLPLESPVYIYRLTDIGRKYCSLFQ